MGFKYALNNILRKKLLNFIIVVQIVLGLFSSYLMININETLQNEIYKIENTFNGGNVFSITGNWEYYDFLTENYDAKKIFNRINSIKGLQIPLMLHIGVNLNDIDTSKFNGKDINIMGENSIYLDGISINEMTINKFNLKTSSGRFFNELEYEKIIDKTIPIVLGDDFKDIFNLNDIIPIDGLGKIGVENLKIIGFIEKDNSLPINLGKSINQKYKSINLNNMVLTTKKFFEDESIYPLLLTDSYLFLDENLNNDGSNDIKNNIKKIFNDENIEVNVRSEKIGIDLSIKDLKEKQHVFTISSIIIIIFTGLTIIVTLLNSIENRKKEFGTYLLCGANTNDLTSIILYELILINMISLVIFITICLMVFKTVSLNIIFIIILFIITYVIILAIAPVIKLNRYSIKDLIKGDE